jgi:predicted transcriptional regulator
MNSLNPKEEAVMQIIWRLEKAFLKEILEAIDNPKPPTTTIASIVKKLENMKLVGHKSYGNMHQYFPLVEKEAYRKSAFRKFINNYFGGSPEQVLSFFIEEENIDPAELNELLEKIKERENDKH